MDATNLLLENVDKTFVTPVFNGSASLRDAAGQLIESTVRTVRRKETVDDAYMEKLYEETYTAFHLDQIQVDGEWKRDFGSLPTAAVILLASLAGTWLILGTISVVGIVKRRKKQE